MKMDTGDDISRIALRLAFLASTVSVLGEAAGKFNSDVENALLGCETQLIDLSGDLDSISDTIKAAAAVGRGGRLG